MLDDRGLGLAPIARRIEPDLVEPWPTAWRICAGGRRQLPETTAIRSALPGEEKAALSGTVPSAARQRAAHIRRRTSRR